MRSDEETGPRKLDVLSGTSIKVRLRCIETGYLSRIAVFRDKNLFLFIRLVLCLKNIINVNCSQKAHFQYINNQAEFFEIWHNIVPVCTD